MWTTINFNTPTTFPKFDNEIWICHWSRETGASTVEPAVWNKALRDEVLNAALNDSIDGLLFLWADRTIPKAPVSVDIVERIRCHLAPGITGPCKCKFDSSGMCLAIPVSHTPAHYNCMYSECIFETKVN